MSKELTPEELITNEDTRKHIATVSRVIHFVVKELLDRADRHDQSKLETPEVEEFAKHNHKLAGTTYGSKDSKDNREALKPALDHHYAKNDHHPEHFKHGVSDMDLVQLIELFCDWKASSLRHHDGNLRKSIEVNAERYRLDPQLIRIFENTAVLLDGV